MVQQHTERLKKKGQANGWIKKDDINKKTAGAQDVQNAYQGLIRGTLDTKDYSNGAYFWHGTDFGTTSEPANKSYYQVGFEFTDTSHDLWNQGNHKSGNKSWDYKYQSTSALGKTTFMKLTPAWQKATGGRRWDGRSK
jgi:hypothetical protein